MSARALTILGLGLWLAAAGLRGAGPEATIVVDELPPQVAIARIALGGLSPLLADLLWLRAAEQQEARQYFAMAATTRQIALLQPESPGLIVFQARNLAFNVAGEFRDPAARWSWIRRGLDLLLQEGMGNLSEEPAIDEAVATILLGRIGDRFDPQSVGDRLSWARIWQPVVVDTSDGRVALRAAPDVALLAQWRMNSDEVQAVDRRFGPLDWRTPEAHAVYWSTQAIRKAGGETRRPIAARLRYQALWAAFQGGRMVLDPDRGRLELLPDSRLVEPLIAELERLQTLLPQDRELQVARLNVERDAVLVLYLEGRESAAADRLAAARREVPGGGALEADLPAAVLAAAGWPVHPSPEAATEFVVDSLRASARLREIGAADLGRGWERIARLAWAAGGELLPSFGELLEQSLAGSE